MVCFLLTCIFYVTTPYSADQTAASCDSVDIQSAIDTCISTGGGTITLPACSDDNTWTSTDKIDVDTSTEIKIIGAGKTSTVIGYADGEIPSAGAPGMYFKGGGLVELSNFTFRGSDTANVAVGIRIYNNLTENLEIHDLKIQKFSNTALYLCSNDAMAAPTLVYNCEIGDQRGVGMYGIRLTGTGDNTDYVIPASFGTDNPNAVFIEDNTFDDCYHSTSSFGISNIVFRYNTITNPTSYLDGHGPCYDIGCNNDPGEPDAGTYIYEIYNNNIDCGSYPWGVNIRGGTGIMTDNTFTSCTISMRLEIENCSEGTNCTDANNCPMSYTVEGTDCFQSPDQWWLWDNTTSGTAFATDGSECIRACSGEEPTTANCEYILAALSGYEKYTYPHPLRALEQREFRGIGGANFNIN